MLTRRLAYWLPPLIYAAAIYQVSSQSEPFPSLAHIFWDKATHAAEYAIFAILLCRALRSERLPWAAAVPLAVVLVSAYGGSDEWHQMSVPLRSADGMDWLADTIGGTVGCLAYRAACARWFPRV